MNGLKLFLILITITLLFGCTKENKLEDIDDLLKNVNTNRVSSHKIIKDINGFLYNFNEYEIGLRKEDIELLTEYDINSRDEYFNPHMRITKMQAIEDTEHLFDFLKYSYAPYAFFGGDQTFNKAKLYIINTINNVNGDTLSSEYLSNTIINNLNFIQDSHFSINGYKFIEKKYYFYNEKLEFLLDNKKGYYTYINNIKYYIKDIDNNNNLNQYLKLSINKRGDLVYYLGNIQALDESHYLKVKLFDKNNNEILKNIELKSATYLDIDNDEIFNERIEGNIPIISIRKMIEHLNNNLFPNTANIVKRYPISIIDIRGNIGGQDILGMQWFKNFTGKEANKICTTATLYSKVNNHITSKYLQNINSEYREEYIQKIIENEREKIKSNKNQWGISLGSNAKIKNDTIIFVLVDKRTSSSAESFIEFLFNLENVIFVGTNTGGVGLSDIYTYGRLYNSKINFHFGRMISIYDNRIFNEGIGFLPDIWIGDDTALEKILLLVNKQH